MVNPTFSTGRVGSVNVFSRLLYFDVISSSSDVLLHIIVYIANNMTTSLRPSEILHQKSTI